VANLEKIYHEPVLVEEYIDGRELNVTVLGNGKNAKVLPTSEIIFGKSFAHKYKVVDFAAKWQKDSSAYKDTVGFCPAKLSEESKKKIEETCLAAFRITGCRDYARVDIRLSKEGIPFVLEVNANPGVGPEDGATRSALAAGYSYPSFLSEIVKIALLR
jgi:D-alanine-D-alanine ligase